MPKRVSVKGKGADLFFGDYDPVGGAAQPTESVPANGQSTEQLPEVSPTAPAPASVASVDPVTETPTKGSRAKSASQRASRAASAPANEHASALASMLASVESETIE